MNRFSFLVIGIIFVFILSSIIVFAQERSEDQVPRDTYVDTTGMNTGTNEGTVDVLEYADPDHIPKDPAPTPTPEGALVMLIWHLVWLI